MLSIIDTRLFYFFNVGLKNFLFDMLMPLFARHEEWLPVFFLVFCAGIYFNHKKCLKAFLFAVVAVSLSDFLIHHFVKPFFGRVRPCNALPAETFHLLVGCGGSYSFPSQHASNMFALAATVGYCYRGLKYVLMAVGSVVAFSRVYLGVHYPFDVLFGAFFGLFSASVVIWIPDRKFFFQSQK
ncbi:MAG: phosphatase PAP2 family protein [Nitrospinota bacterium]